MYEGSRDPTPDELAALDDLRGALGQFLAEHTGFASPGPPTPGRLDAAHDAWLMTRRPDPRTVVDLLGVGLGDLIVAGTDMDWRMGRFGIPGRGTGEVPVVAGTPSGGPHGEVFCPPFEVAAKRIESGERTWVASTIAELIRSLTAMNPGGGND